MCENWLPASSSRFRSVYAGLCVIELLGPILLLSVPGYLELHRKITWAMRKFNHRTQNVVSIQLRSASGKNEGKVLVEVLYYGVQG